MSLCLRFAGVDEAGSSALSGGATERTVPGLGGDSGFGVRANAPRLRELWESVNTECVQVRYGVCSSQIERVEGTGVSFWNLWLLGVIARAYHLAGVSSQDPLSPRAVLSQNLHSTYQAVLPSTEGFGKILPGAGQSEVRKTWKSST